MGGPTLFPKLNNPHWQPVFKSENALAQRTALLTAPVRQGHHGRLSQEGNPLFDHYAPKITLILSSKII